MWKSQSVLFFCCLLFLVGFWACANEPGNQCLRSSDCPGQQLCIAGQCEKIKASDSEKKPAEPGSEPTLEKPVEPTKEPVADSSEPVADAKEPVRDGSEPDSEPVGEPSTPDEPTQSDGPPTDQKPAECKEKETRSCYTGASENAGVGLCKKGVQVCEKGKWSLCVGSVLPTTEICDGKDNNCDGKTDEGCKCIDGKTQPCGNGTGECRKGTQTCKDGTWGSCQNQVGPKSEICDGKDNDCDGQTDEGLSRACFDGTSSQKNQGICKEGKQTCSSGKWGTCVGQVLPAKEVCDRKDNDCDGKTDEGCKCVNGDTQACGKDTGECKRGTQTCFLGNWSSCRNSVGPKPEVCDGKDNDCDGQTDENNVCIADLTVQITSVSLGASPYSPSGASGNGSSLQIRYLVTNKGTASASGFRILFHLGATSSRTSLSVLGTSSSTLSVNKGNTMTGTVTLRLSSSITNGTHYLHAYVDDAGKVQESNETNNTTARSFGVTGVPNLMVSTWSVSSGPYKPGSTATLSYRVFNAGATRVKSSFTVGFYLATNATLSSGAVLLKSVTVTSLNSRSYAPAKTGIVTVTIPSSKITASHVYLGAFVDSGKKIKETSESDNVRSSRISLTLQPDYVISELRLYSSKLPGQGSSILVYFRVRNQGLAGSTSTKFTTSIYYADSSSGSGRITLGTYTLTSLKAGATSSLQTKILPLPNRVLYGTRAILARADVGRNIAESNENNNERATLLSITGKPDLKFEKTTVVGIFGTQYTRNSPVTTTVQLKNAGKSRTATSFVVSVYYSSDKVLSTSSDTLLGSYTISSQMPAGTFFPTTKGKTFTISGKIPANAAYGTRYIAVKIDAKGSISESSESNNLYWKAIAVSTSIRPPGPLP